MPGGARDPRLAGFVKDGPGDTCPPSAALAAGVEDLSGPERHCEDATDDELIGLLGRWDALESWVAAGKLGVVRELIRRRARPGPGGYQPMHGDLPDQWHEGLAHEVSVALGLSVRGADKLTCFAWDLQATEAEKLILDQQIAGQPLVAVPLAVGPLERGRDPADAPL